MAFELVLIILPIPCDGPPMLTELCILPEVIAPVAISFAVIASAAILAVVTAPSCNSATVIAFAAISSATITSTPI